MSAKPAGTAAVTLQGHTGGVHALTYSSGTGQYLLSGSADRTINLYNPSKAIDGGGGGDAPAALVQTYAGAHGYDVLSLAVADDNARFASGGGDKTVFLWDVATAATLRRYGGHGGRVEAVAFGGEGDAVVASASADCTVRFWDTKSANTRAVATLDDAKDTVGSLAVAGHEVHAGSVDGRARTYDLRMGLVHVDVVGQPVTSLTPTAQGDALLVSTLDSTVRLLDKADGKLLMAYREPRFANATYRARSTLACRDAVVLAGAEDGAVYAWDVVSGQLLQRVEHGSAAQERPSRRVVAAVACRRRGGEWASAAGDGSVVVWR